MSTCARPAQPTVLNSPSAGFALPMVMAWLMLAAWMGQEALQQVWLDARLQTTAMTQAHTNGLLNSAVAAARHDALQRVIVDMPGWWERLHELPEGLEWQTACLNGVCAADRTPPVAVPWNQNEWTHPIWSEPASSVSSTHTRHSLWLSQRMNVQGQVVDWRVQAWVMVYDPENEHTWLRLVEVR